MFGFIRVCVLVCVAVVGMFVGLAGFGAVGGLLWDAALGLAPVAGVPWLLLGSCVLCVGGLFSMMFAVERLDLV